MLGSGQDFSVDSSTSAAGRADEAEVEPQSAISSAIAPTAESAATTQEDDTEEKDPMDLMSQPTSLFERRAEKPMRKPAVLQQPQAAAPSPAALINYRGVNISMACQEGNLAACVLLWGIAAAKRITLMDADAEGNNPMHFACMADNPEVIGFLIQQTRGMLDATTRLMDSRNKTGETPLMRSMVNSVPTVVKALLEEGSDPLVRDYKGNTVFTICAKAKQLWMLNLMYEIISANFGKEKADALLRCKDNEKHGVLDWAADAGDVNMVEYLLRKGVSPHDYDDKNRGPLFWAAKSRRAKVCRLLYLACGCDPHAVDSDTGTSPYSIAKASGDERLMTAFSEKSSFFDQINSKPRAAAAKPQYPKIDGDDKRNGLLEDGQRRSDDLESGPGGITTDDFVKAIYVDMEGKSRCLATPTLNDSDPVNAAVYAIVTFSVWLGTVIIPFWIWAICFGVGAYLYNRYAKEVSAVQRRVRQSGAFMNFTFIQRILGAPEKYLGFWIGCMAFVFFYFLLCFIYEFGDSNPFELDTLNAISEEGGLFYVSLVLVVILVSAHGWLVWVDTDPGMVMNRQSSFDEAMDASYEFGGSQPPSDVYCRTSLVHKPLRSKFCQHSGFVVARMDHYCVWLNNAVGYGNHRLFYFVLVVHVLAAIFLLALVARMFELEIDSRNADGTGWEVASALFGQRLFFLTAFCAFLALVSVGLIALLAEQTINMLKNQTTNERVNASRYSWMVDKTGKPNNRFNRGYLTNVLEFFRICGYGVDYFEVYTLDGRDETQMSNDSLMNSITNKMHDKTPIGISSQQQRAQQQQTCDDDHEGCNHDHDHGHSHGHGHDHMHDV